MPKTKHKSELPFFAIFFLVIALALLLGGIAWIATDRTPTSKPIPASAGISKSDAIVSAKDTHSAAAAPLATSKRYALQAAFANKANAFRVAKPPQQDETLIVGAEDGGSLDNGEPDWVIAQQFLASKNTDPDRPIEVVSVRQLLWDASPGNPGILYKVTYRIPAKFGQPEEFDKINLLFDHANKRIRVGPGWYPFP